MHFGYSPVKRKLALQQLGDKNRPDAFIWHQAERNIEEP
jgi:hypothetical protein